MRTVNPWMKILPAAATVLLGWIVLVTPLGVGLVQWSYDFLQLFLPRHSYSDPVIIHMDQEALQDYQLKPGQAWPRAIHARLVDRLTRDQARVVVFDVTLTQPGDPAADDLLAQAIRRNGRVVLAGDRVPVRGIELSYTIVPPYALFETNAAAWGTAKIHLDSDRVGRRYDSGDDQEPGLDWAAATVAGADFTRDPTHRLSEIRWLNYYGVPRPFEGLSMSYTNAESQAPGFFKGKAVFIGGKPETLLRGEETDLFASPFTKWNSTFVPGVELTAIAYSNLVRTEWLSRPSPQTEAVVLLLTGIGFWMGLARASGRGLLMRIGASILLTAIVVITAVVATKVWFPWGIVLIVQLPCAVFLRWAVIPGTGATAGDKLTTGGPLSVRVGSPPADGEQPPDSLSIPDHTPIRCIGEGAYGQVWIARNAVGIYHAVKVVYRNRFGSEIPYERAFRGIQMFMPISRSHDGFVHLLHVGRNDATGMFFYIMELGDDAQTGQQIDPAAYVPRTLASELKQHGALAPRECLEVMTALAAAVEQLHQHQLVHRDIKPANIIFVNRRPKLADIDLVTELSELGNVSRIGTEGYLAPEGPGTAAGDVFSLGRVLYVALTAKQPEQLPELPTRVTSHPDSGLILDLNRIACKACEAEVSRRYASVAAMREDLLELSRRMQ